MKFASVFLSALISVFSLTAYAKKSKMPEGAAIAGAVKAAEKHQMAGCGASEVTYLREHAYLVQVFCDDGSPDADLVKVAEVSSTSYQAIVVRRVWSDADYGFAKIGMCAELLRLGYNIPLCD